jgi:hypothetical protein
MNTSTHPSSNNPARDKDLAEQARPGHGVPSQDPNPAAQLPLEPGEAEREANSALTGGGVVGGAAVGAAIGGAVGGPVGVLVGGSVGAVAGALGGAAAGSMMNTGNSSGSAGPANQGGEGSNGSEGEPEDPRATARGPKP